MFGFNLMQIAGAVLLAGVGLIGAYQNRGTILESLGVGSSPSPAAGSARGPGLSEYDLKKADDLCFALGAIARKSNRDDQRATILGAVHTIEGALTLEPAKTVARKESAAWQAPAETQPASV